MTSDSPPDPQRARGAPSTLAGAFWALLVLAAGYGIAVTAARPPAPRGSETPATEFAATRALERLARVLGDEEPHPVGSEAHPVVRARLVREWEALGYTPELQSTVARGPNGTFAQVHNVLVRRSGRAPGPAVLLVAHYDSVAAGPGAADDGLGVACLLEIAANLNALPPLERDVVFLVSDAEEIGLVGATAFVEEHPWAQDIGAVVNLEMRGSGGRSFLFQTGPNAGELIARFGSSAPRPTANSLAAEVYRHMPNDTDFTVFLDRGLSGANLAGIADHARYHTPLDKLENLDAGTLQHQGEQALALLRALSTGPLPTEGAGERVYTDIFGRFLIGWPAGWTAWLALAALALGLASVMRLRRLGIIGKSEVVAGAIAIVALVAIAAALGIVWTLALQGLTGEEQPWFTHAAPTRTGYVALAFFAVLVTARTVGRTAGFWGLWCAGILAGAVVSFALAFLAPGVSFVFLVPSLVGGLLPHVSTAMRSPREGRSREIAMILTLTAATIVWMPLWLGIELAMGTGTSLATTLPLALFGVVLAPLVAEWQTSLAWMARVACLLGVLAAGAWAVSVPAYDAEHPQKLNLIYVLDGDTDESRWAWWAPFGAVPAPALGALGEGVDEVDLFGWAPRALLVPQRPSDGPGAVVRVPAAGAPLWGVLAPVVEVSAVEPRDTEAQAPPQGHTRLRARLRSLRGAEALHLCLPDGSELETVTIGEDEWSIDDDEQADGGPRDPQLSFHGLDDRVVQVQWIQPSGEEFVVFDSSSRLPSQAAEVLAGRPLAATPAYFGDVSIVFRRVTP